MATYDVPLELLTAIWGDEPDHVETKVNHLVWGLHQKIELYPSDSQFLQSVRGLGYRLETRPLK